MSLRCNNDGIVVSSHHGDVTATYNVWFRTSDGGALSQPVSDVTAKSCPGTLLTPVGSAVSSVGVAQSSPSPRATPGTAPADSPLGIPLIGAVRVISVRFYHIDLAGLEKLGGNDVYHLKLKAYREPVTHPLTDLYVDQKTFLVREARGEVSAHYVIASGRLAGVLDFDRAGAYWIVQHEHFDVAANAVFVHTHMTVAIDGSNFATPNELPNVAFPTPKPGATAR